MQNTPRTPPRFVPTLTEVVASHGVPAAGPQAASVELISLVMQEVDMQLEKSLREIVARVVIEHVDGMLPTLRNEIEHSVTVLVREALAKQLR